MTETIGNPLSWSVDAVRGAARGVEAAAGTVGSHALAKPEVRRIDIGDLRESLRLGWEDFQACRSDVMFLVVLYPVIGLVMAWMATQGALAPLLFPAAAGFALVGPAAAVGLYELSRRREKGESATWADAMAVTASPSFGAILALAAMQGLVFVVWMATARGIWAATLGPEAPGSLWEFLREVLTTQAGLGMAISGIATGFLFAAVVLTTSVVSFPLLLDRKVGLPVAVLTSIRVAQLNPGPVAVWGLIVAGLLALGSLPLFLGLIVALPVLGHASWHLYRRAVTPLG
jgi:uncharacterized membrane protein